MCSANKIKRILIVTQYIYPEPFKSSELAFELAKKGYEVDVLTSIPNYPEGKYYKGYGLFRKRIERINNVTFYRCFQTPRKFLPGFAGQSLNYLSFVFSSVLWVMGYFVWKRKYDAIIAHEPSPITQIIPACILGKFRRVPVYSWIQDIWPDSVISAAGEKGKILEKPLNMITEWIYKNSDKILITSKGMTRLINRHKDYSEKIIYYPQWSEDMLLGIDSPVSDIPSNSSYNIMMCGSLNSGIGIDSIISLCKEMKDDDINFIFVGGGSEENTMREKVRELGLKNVYFTGRKPSNEMSAFFQKADALLLTLKQTNMPHLDVTVPARLQSYLSSGKPILAMIGSGVREIIAEADCGYSVPAGEFKNLAKIIRERVLPQKKEFSLLGANGRSFYEFNFTKEHCINKLCDIITKQ